MKQQLITSQHHPHSSLYSFLLFLLSRHHHTYLPHHCHSPPLPFQGLPRRLSPDSPPLSPFSSSFYCPIHVRPRQPPRSRSSIQPTSPPTLPQPPTLHSRIACSVPRPSAASRRKPSVG